MLLVEITFLALTDFWASFKLDSCISPVLSSDAKAKLLPEFFPLAADLDFAASTNLADWPDFFLLPRLPGIEEIPKLLIAPGPRIDVSLEAGSDTFNGLRLIAPLQDLRDNAGEDVSSSTPASLPIDEEYLLDFLVADRKLSLETGSEAALGFFFLLSFLFFFDNSVPADFFFDGSLFKTLEPALSFPRSTGSATGSMSSKSEPSDSSFNGVSGGVSALGERRPDAREPTLRRVNVELEALLIP